MFCLANSDQRWAIRSCGSKLVARLSGHLLRHLILHFDHLYINSSCWSFCHSGGVANNSRDIIKIKKTFASSVKNHLNHVASKVLKVCLPLVLNITILRSSDQLREKSCLDANFVNWNIVKEESLCSLGCETTVTHQILTKIMKMKISGGQIIPHICHFFTQAKFLVNEIYTKKRVN